MPSNLEGEEEERMKRGWREDEERMKRRTREEDKTMRAAPKMPIIRDQSPKQQIFNCHI